MTDRTTESTRPRWVRLFVALPFLFAAMAALLWWIVLPGNPEPLAPMIGSVLSWMLLFPAVLLLRYVPRRRVGVAVVAGTILLGLIAAGAPPRTSNDSARYAWDGIVQKAGISPYSFTPIDETIAYLRPDWLFTPGASGPDGQPICPAGLFGTESVPTSGFPSGEALCTAINRPHVPTIYPPTAEIYFLGVRAVIPDTVGFIAFQLGGLILNIGVTVMLLFALSRRRLPAQLAAVWAWSPFVLLEAVNNAHIDVLGAALVLAAGMVLLNGKPLASGAAFGAAIATKLIPLIAVPALLFHRPARFIAAAAGTFVLLYVPYVAISGISVLGFLPGYLREEGYSQSSGIRFGLAQIISGGPWPAILSAAVLAIIAVAVLRSTRPSNLWEKQTVMIGLTLLIVSPNYPWYALLLLPFIVLSRRWEYVAVILALDFIYMVPQNAPYGDPTQQCVLLAAALAISAVAWQRSRKQKSTSATTSVQFELPL